MMPSKHPSTPFSSFSVGSRREPALPTHRRRPWLPVVDLEAMVGLSRPGRPRVDQDQDGDAEDGRLTELAARLTVLFK